MVEEASEERDARESGRADGDGGVNGGGGGSGGESSWLEVRHDLVVRISPLNNYE